MKILKNIRNTLNDDGYIILELWSMKNVLKKINQDGEIFKTWSKFDDLDPFSFVLESLEKDENEFIIWNKYFIHKHKSINDDRNIMKNILKPYSTKEIKNLIKEQIKVGEKIYEKQKEVLNKKYGK